MAAVKKKIGYALGGGSARGLAHIGVLKVLEEKGIYPDVVAGTSIGAIIGALYAGGHKPNEMEQLVLGLNWKKLISLADMTFPVSGLFQGKKVVSLLKSIIGDLNFEQLQYAFSCVATNIINGEQVVLKEGSLVEAVRASISIPGIFTPVLISGAYLVDGGLVNTVPVSICREMGADFVIGINVIPEPGKAMCSPTKDQSYPDCEPFTAESDANNSLSGIHGRTMQSHIDDINNATRHFLISHRPDTPQNKFKLKTRKKDINIASGSIKVPHLIDVLSQTITIAEYKVAVENMKGADIAISPDVSNIGFWQYNNARQAILIGEQAAREALSDKKLLNLLN
jgi:predicted acylesterase/phospholipase RssA